MVARATRGSFTSATAGIHWERPATWEVARFTLGATRPSGLPQNATAFNILDAAAPFLKDLPTGRSWPES
jgi:hypothetical protein